MEQNARDYQKCYKNAIMLKVEIAMIEKTNEILSSLRPMVVNKPNLKHAPGN